ncbi:hypothetical protein HY631_04255 [Candidatus Uhrbacteria bacterium]|nr:hypothetical protein [Candidatus Uhrbacteria bacterium]
MPALHELLLHLGNRHFNAADHHRALLALIDRLDLMQTMTVGMRRTAWSGADVVDGAIAPDGRTFFVERKNNRSWLYAQEGSALGMNRTKIASENFVSLCGFPDGKTLAYATYDGNGCGLLHFGDWMSDPIPFRADDGALFWEHEGQVYAAARNWQSSEVVAFQIFHLPECAPVLEATNPTRGHAVINGKLSWLEEIAVREHGGKVEVVHWGDWESPAFPNICGESVSVNPKTGVPRFVMRSRNEFRLIENNSASACGLPIISENKMFSVRQENIPTPGGDKPWRLVVEAMDDPAWHWSRNQVSSLRGICFLPESGDTVLLINRDTNHKSDGLEVVVIDRHGKEGDRQRIEGATGKMRRIGNQIAVEGRDEHGKTLSLFQEGWVTHPLVGSFDRLVALSDNTIAGWHYSNGVISVQHYV